MTNTQRKLATILAADAAGYSRLMGDDEKATVQTLTEYRQVFSDHISRHQGRVVDTAGDSVLAVFDSPVEALECSVEIQMELTRRNRQLAEHRRMLFRIGLNLGDVLTSEDATIYGDGVNIAARLQTLADSSGICVSGTVYDQVEGKLPVAFKFAGEQSVKNIAKPVRAYHAMLEFADKPGPGASPAPARRPAPLIASLVGAAILIAAVAWYAAGLRSPAGPSQQDPVLAMPSGPAIAVLPFTNLDGNPSQDYFSDGLTEDVITELSSVRELHVLARNTTFQYKGQGVDVPALGRKLGVQYVLEGSVRRSKDRVRVTAQLIDATDGAHLWADRYDRELKDIFVVQDEITTRIVSAIAAGSGGLLQQSARSRAAGRRPENLAAYELVLRATAPPAYTQQWYDEKTALLEQAIRIDPNYARALQEYAWHKLLGWIFRFQKSPLPPEEIRQNAIKAVRLDPGDALAHRTAAYGYFFDHQLDFFEKEAQLAFELAPYNADIFAQLGMATEFMGQWERGLSLVKKAYQLNPVSTAGWYHSAMHYDYYRKHQYRQALEVIRAHPAQAFCETQWKYVAAYGQLGEPHKAKEHWDRCVATVPGFSADWMAEMQRVWNFQEPFLAHYMEGISKAGYPCRNPRCISNR